MNHKDAKVFPFPLYAKYRADGWGAAAFDPKMMTALLLYAYCVGERSSRRIERLCERDIAFRVITANARPDHSTTARFRQENRETLEELFIEILRLCAEAGLVKLGVVALDGTKLKANAALSANRTGAGLSAAADPPWRTQRESKLELRSAKEAFSLRRGPGSAICIDIPPRRPYDGFQVCTTCDRFQLCPLWTNRRCVWFVQQALMRWNPGWQVHPVPSGTNNFDIERHRGYF